MKLAIGTSGGFGNLRIQGQLETDQLEPGLAARVRSTLSPERLEALGVPAGGPVADAVQYEVTLFLQPGVKRFVVDEAAAPADVQEVLHALVKAIVHMRKAGG